MPTLFLVIAAALSQAPVIPSLRVTPAVCDFGTIPAGAPVACTFTIRNEGRSAARVAGASLARPLVLRRAPAVIEPGGDVQLQIDLPTSGLDGEYEGALTLRLAGGEPTELVLTVKGLVRAPVTFVPAAAFYLAGHAGETAAQSIEIVNQEAQPLAITGVSAAPEGTALRLERLEEGRRYRLTLTLEPDGPLGQRESDVVLTTDSAVRPTLRVRASTWRRPRVYTFPESVDMGAIALVEVAAAPERFAQTLMLYQRGGTDFQAKFTIDSPLVSVVAERGPKGDRYQVTLAYRSEALVVGKVAATLTVETNDAEFPKLEVPVRGTILGK